MPSVDDLMARVSNPSGIPERYADHTLDGYDGSVSPSCAAALAAARDLAAGRIRSLVLIGKPGVGKTHLAAGALRGWAARRSEEGRTELASYRAAVAAWREDNPDPMRARVMGIPEPRYPDPPTAPVWVNVPSLLMGLRAEMGNDPDERPARSAVSWARTNPELVVLDDIGREKASDWTSEVLYELVNARYEAMRPTMATSNLSGEELVAAGYWPVVSRLAEDGRLVTVEAPDRRLRRAS